MAQPIDLAVLQAAPLTWVDKKGFAHPVPPLDFAVERDRLRKSFEEAGVAISVRFERRRMMRRSLPPSALSAFC